MAVEVAVEAVAPNAAAVVEGSAVVAEPNAEEVEAPEPNVEEAVGSAEEVEPNVEEEAANAEEEAAVAALTKAVVDLVAGFRLVEQRGRDNEAQRPQDRLAAGAPPIRSAVQEPEPGPAREQEVLQHDPLSAQVAGGLDRVRAVPEHGQVSEPAALGQARALGQPVQGRGRASGPPAQAVRPVEPVIALALVQARHVLTERAAKGRGIHPRHSSVRRRRP